MSFAPASLAPIASLVLKRIPFAVGALALGLATAGPEAGSAAGRAGEPPVGPRALRHCAGVVSDFGQAAGRPSGTCLLLTPGPGMPLCRVAIALASVDSQELQECLEWPIGGPGLHPDSDRDGVTDPLDRCPLDPDKSTPGWCGCGVADIDGDGDGVPDCLGGCLEGDDGCDDDEEDEPCTPLEILSGTCVRGI